VAGERSRKTAIEQDFKSRHGQTNLPGGLTPTLGMAREHLRALWTWPLQCGTCPPAPLELLAAGPGRGGPLNETQCGSVGETYFATAPASNTDHYRYFSFDDPHP